MSFNYRFEPLTDFEDDRDSGCVHCNKCNELDYCPLIVEGDPDE